MASRSSLRNLSVPRPTAGSFSPVDGIAFTMGASSAAAARPSAPSHSAAPVAKPAHTTSRLECCPSIRLLMSSFLQFRSVPLYAVAIENSLHLRHVGIFTAAAPRGTERPQRIVRSGLVPLRPERGTQAEQHPRIIRRAAQTGAKRALRSGVRALLQLDGAETLAYGIEPSRRLA